MRKFGENTVVPVFDWIYIPWLPVKIPIVQNPGNDNKSICYQTVKKKDKILWYTYDHLIWPH